MEDSRLERLEAKVDKLDLKTDRMVDLLIHNAENNIKNTAILEEHQRRSVANEEATAILRQQLDPIKTHVMWVNNLCKFVVAAGTFTAFLYKLGVLDKLLK